MNTQLRSTFKILLLLTVVLAGSQVFPHAAHADIVCYSQVNYSSDPDFPDWHCNGTGLLASAYIGASGPDTIGAGQSTQLSWSGDGYSASISGVGGVTPSGGTVTVSPTVTTTYTLTENGDSVCGNLACFGSPATYQVTITVLPNPPPTCSMSISPGGIYPGNGAVLTWSAQNYNSFQVDHGLGAIPSNYGIYPPGNANTSATYIGTASGPGGTVNCSAGVVITNPPGGPTYTLPGCTGGALPPGAIAVLSNGNAVYSGWQGGAQASSDIVQAAQTIITQVNGQCGGNFCAYSAANADQPETYSFFCAPAQIPETACSAPPNGCGMGGGNGWTTNGSGCSVSTPLNSSCPAPTVSCSVSPPSGTTAATYTWTAVPAGGVSPYTYSWSGTGGLSGTGVSKNITYASAATYTGSVTVTDSVGHSSASTACSNSASVSSAAAPDLTAGAVSPGSAATGVAQNYTATVSNLGNAATGAGFTDLFQTTTAIDGNGNATATVNDVGTYSSAAIGASPGNNTATLSYAFLSSGTFYVRACADKSSAADVNGVISESNQNNNCGAWTAVVVTAGGNPTGSCSVSPASGTTATPFTWSATASGGSGGYTYAWSDTSGTVNGQTGQSLSPVTYSSAATYTASVTITDSLFHSSPAIACSNSASVSAAAAPNCTLSPGAVSINPGGSTNLTWSCTNVTSCTWSDGPSASPASGGVRSVSLAGPYQVNCLNGSTPGSSNIATVTVLTPAATITASPVRVPAGATSKITWDSANVTSCVESGGITANTKSNTPAGQNATINGQTTFVITCQSPYGIAQATTTVNVNGSTKVF